MFSEADYCDAEQKPALWVVCLLTWRIFYEAVIGMTMIQHYGAEASAHEALRNDVMYLVIFLQPSINQLTSCSIQ